MPLIWRGIACGRFLQSTCSPDGHCQVLENLAQSPNILETGAFRAGTVSRMREQPHWGVNHAVPPKTSARSTEE